MQASKNQRAAVAVTGGAGLIGTRVVEALAGDFKVFILDAADWPHGEPPGDSELLEIDLTEDRDVSRAMAELHRRCDGRLASFIHLAAHYDFSGADSPLYEELSVRGTRRLLRKLREFDAEQFVFASTLLVMEPVEGEGRLTEASTTQAEWPYPESKLETEAVIDEERGTTPVVILRLAGVYDEAGNSPPLCQHIKRIYEKALESYVFPGDKDSGQPYVHLEDVVACVEKTVARRRELGEREVFLIAEPEVMSHDELQETLGRLIHGREWPTIRVPKPVAKVGAWIQQRVLGREMFIKPWMVELADDHYPVAIDKARERLGWEPSKRLREVLRDMVGNLFTDVRGWYERNGLEPPPQEQAEHEEELESGAGGGT